MAAMTPQEIKVRIDELYQKLENCIDPCMFVLNKDAQQYQDEIEQLRGQCKHDFENGTCKYCYILEK